MSHWLIGQLYPKHSQQTFSQLLLINQSLCDSIQSLTCYWCPQSDFLLLNFWIQHLSGKKNIFRKRRKWRRKSNRILPVISSCGANWNYRSSTTNSWSNPWNRRIRPSLYADLTETSTSLTVSFFFFF